jgi:hypothetical protein
MNVVLTDVQKVHATAQPVNLLGNAVPVDGPIRWTCSDPEMLDLVVSDTGFECDIITTGKLGNCVVTAVADADLSEGVREISSAINFEVKASEATQLTVFLTEPVLRI